METRVDGRVGGRLGGRRDARAGCRAGGGRSRRLRWAALVALLWTLGCGAEAPPARPDVLLIVIDTLRADHLGVYGHPAGPTPRIDALAERSVVFERAIAASTRTAPSHATMMTSRFVRNHAIGVANGTTRLRDEPTLAEAFARAGYDTAAFVSNYVLRRRAGFDRGFDVYDDDLEQTEANRPHILERSADRVAKRAIGWLDEPRDAPFFLWVHFQDPHGPYDPPDEYRARFERPHEDGEAPLAVLDDDLGRGGLPAYQALPGVRFPSEYRSRYLAEIAFVDEWVGRVVEAAERVSADRGLVVLLTSDHGETMGEHGFFFVHGTHTLPGVSHVPFLLSAPGLAAGRRNEIVHHVDVMPTLLELAGLPLPDGAQGRALGRLARGEEDPPDRVVYSDIGAELGAYVGDRYVRILAGDRRRGDASDPHWTTYRWTPGGLAEPSPTDPDLRRRIRPYWEQRPETNPAPLSGEERRRLEALGYLVPRDAAESDASPE